MSSASSASISSGQRCAAANWNWICCLRMLSWLTSSGMNGLSVESPSVHSDSLSFALSSSALVRSRGMLRSTGMSCSGACSPVTSMTALCGSGEAAFTAAANPASRFFRPKNPLLTAFASASSASISPLLKKAGEKISRRPSAWLRSCWASISTAAMCGSALAADSRSVGGIWSRLGMDPMAVTASSTSRIGSSMTEEMMSRCLRRMV